MGGSSNKAPAGPTPEEIQASNFAALKQGQADMAASINTGATTANERFNTVDTSLAGLGNTLEGVGSNITTGFTSMQDMMGQNMQANQQSFAGVNDAINQSTGAIQTGLQSGFAGVNQGLTTGFGSMNQQFADVGQRFDRVDEAQQNAQTAIDTGFQTQANTMGNLGTQMADSFNAANQASTEGFAQVGQTLSDLDTSTQAGLGTVQGNLMAGQAVLDQGINQMADTQNVYYDDMAQRQQAIQQGQDEFRSNFEDYVDRYSDDTTLANQTRADIQSGQVNATNRLREDIGRYMDAQGNLLESRFNAAGQQAGQVSTNVEQLLSSAEANQQQTMRTMANNQSGLMSQMAGSQADAADRFTRFQQQIAGGFQNLDAEGVRQAKELASIAAAQTDLDMGMRQNFQQLGGAFDDTGRLISNTVLENGTAVSRAVDQNGNLLLRSFDATGRDIGTKVINLNKALNDLGSLPFVAGGNVSMGNLSPAMQGAVPTGGFASPYAITR